MVSRLSESLASDACKFMRGESRSLGEVHGIRVDVGWHGQCDRITVHVGAD